MRSFVALIAVAVVISALSLVYVRHQNRVKYVQLRDLETQRDELEIDWRELLIESRAVSKHHRVDRDARDLLGMRVPDPTDVYVVDMQANGESRVQAKVSER